MNAIETLKATIAIIDATLENDRYGNPEDNSGIYNLEQTRANLEALLFQAECASN